MTPSAGVDLLVLGSIFSPDEGALHPHQTEDEAQHAQGQSGHQEASYDLDVSLHRPEHGVIIAVADSSRVCEAGPPQAGPVPGHLDDGRAPHAPDGGDLPALHGHGAGHEDPAQHRHQEAPDLDHSDLHLCESIPPQCLIFVLDRSSTVTFG